MKVNVIRLRMLGALDLRNADGRELPEVLAQPKRLALLAFLALARPRGFHRRDSLLPVLWPEQDSEHGRNGLTQAVYFLRRWLGAHVLVSGRGDELGLASDALWCDAVAFETALDEGRTTDALALYRGDLLDGVHVADAPEFERWLGDERARLAGRYQRAMELEAAERERAGDLVGAAEWWRRIAGRDPYSSRAALHLARALTLAGEPAAALRCARAHEALLRDELGIAPSAELVAFVRQLLEARIG